jgi:DNA-binding response OmpR family regulator
MDVFMNRLRKILAVEPLAVIETLPQVGYRFVLRTS